MTKLIVIGFLLGIAFCMPSQAATNADDFLNSVHSAKAFSLGQSLGMVNHLDAALLNPAEFYVKTPKQQVLLSYSNDFSEEQKMQVGYSMPIQYSPFRVGVVYMSQQISNVPEVEKSSGDPEIVGYFENKNEAVKILSAYQVNPNLSIGANLIVLRETIKTASGMGYGADFGLVYRLLETESLKIAFSNAVRNVSFAGFKVPIQWSGKDYTEAIPATFQTALAISGKLMGNPTIVSLGFNTEITRLKLNPNVGLNYSIIHSQNFACDLRGGLNGAFLTFGVGINWVGLGLDYGYGVHDYLGNSHRVSLKLDF